MCKAFRYSYYINSAAGANSMDKKSRIKLKEKRRVFYTIIGEANKVLAQGVCNVADNKWETENICSHADIDIDRLWSLETTEI